MIFSQAMTMWKPNSSSSRFADAEIEATMADEHILDIALARGLAVKSAYALEAELPHAIALRERKLRIKAGTEQVC